MATIKALAASKAKAIAAVVAPMVVGAFAHYGFHIDVNLTSLLISAGITGLAVHKVTNTPASPAA